MNIVENAKKIAHEAHSQQRRKWGSQEPFTVHTDWCANKAKEIGCDEIEQAALHVHDTLEDIAIPTNTLPYWEGRIRAECGEAVLERVWELTNPSDRKEWMEAHPNPKRVEKWAINLAHIRTSSDKAKRDKMIDRLANCLTMNNAPARMKQKYVPESRELLGACRYVDEKLGQELEDAIDALEKGI